jgi:biopolymer transport protein ExbD
VIRRRTLASVFFCVLMLAATLALAKRDEDSSRIVVMIDHDSHGFVYTINSEKVKDLLRALSERRKSPSPEPEVILLAHKDATLAMVNNMIGILSKAGYEAPRVFVFDSYKDAMNELNFTYSPRIPFSAAGDVPPRE